MLLAFPLLNLTLTLFSSLTPFFTLLSYSSLFNSVTVIHMSNLDTFLSPLACCGAILADSAPQLHNARRELGRQASKCTNAPPEKKMIVLALTKHHCMALAIPLEAQSK